MQQLDLSSVFMHLACALALAVCSLVCTVGCDDLRSFETAPNEVFRGEVLGSDANPAVDSFIRKGFPSHTLLELTFDPYSSDGIASGDSDSDSETLPRTVVAGSVDTYQCPEGRSQCDESERTAGPLVKSPLIAIDALTHDPLSQYTFPGGGRLRNYMFGVHFLSVRNGVTTGRDAMLFISLMDNGSVEVRAMAPSVVARDQQSWPALFGVFPLKRTGR